MDEQSNNKNESDYNNRNSFDSGFIKQEANIFILDKEKLQQIVAMGFPDTDLNATALFESNNKLSCWVLYLCFLKYSNCSLVKIINCKSN